MILSKPITHPDAPERSGYIRGKYESVELIREIPLSNVKSNGDGTNDASELNPVEWIMITRSDPGGGIPRFMVDRGTPSSMLGDVHKWLDWATALNETEAVEAQTVEKSTVQEKATTTAPVVTSDGSSDVKSTAPPPAHTAKSKVAPESASQEQQQKQEGVVSHLSQALEIGIDNYAPAAVSSYMHSRTDSTPTTLADEDDSSSTSSSSAASFMSADEMRRQSIAEDATPPLKAKALDNPAASTSQISLDSASLDTLKTTRSPTTHHDKEVLKLAKQREKLDRKLAKKREDEEARLRRARESENGEQEKAKERHDREVKKSEEKHRRELEKLESRKDRELRKAEEKRAKRDERDVVSRVSRERDQFRSEAELLRRQVDILHEQLGDLQRENTAMASKLGKLGVLDDVTAAGRPRSESGSLVGRSRANTSGEK